MKNKPYSILLLLLLLLIFSISGCKKGDEDPFFSVYSRENACVVNGKQLNTIINTPSISSNY